MLGVEGDFGDWLGELFARVGFGEIAAGNLEAVEEQAGAAGVELIGGDAAENFADGELDAEAIGEVGREGKAGLRGGGSCRAMKTRGALAGLDGAARAVVEVAEELAATLGALGAAEGGATAAAAVGEEVAALEAGGFGVGRVVVSHGVLGRLVWVVSFSLFAPS